MSAWLQALKFATEEAIDGAGGLIKAARSTRAQKSQLGRCQSPNHDDVVTIRDAVILDRLSAGEEGAPFILRAMAAQLGHVAIPIPDVEIDHSEISLQLMVVMKEVGDVSSETIEALRDGKVTAAERDRAIDQIDQMLAAASSLRALYVAAVPARKAGRAGEGGKP